MVAAIVGAVLLMAFGHVGFGVLVLAILFLVG
jgi:hypothetical protein